MELDSLADVIWDTAARDPSVRKPKAKEKSKHSCEAARWTFTQRQCRRPWRDRRYTSEGDEGVADLAAGDPIREKREAIIRIAARHGATEVRLIGSVARGEARPDSDVDLLVTWGEGTSLLDQAALMLDLENLLGRKVDIASEGWVKPSIRESVYRDAIAL